MTLRLAAAIVALALAACATPAPVAGPGPATPAATLDLGNRSDIACDIYRGRALLATVPPGEWVSMPNLSGPRVKLTARCGAERFEAEVDLDGESPRWVVGLAQRPMPTAPARLHLVNRTTQDYDLYLATGRLGSLLAGAERRVGGLPPGAQRVRVVEREGRGAWELSVDAASGVETRLVVDPPRGRLVLRNDSPEPAQIRVGERLSRRVSPGERLALDGLATGAWRVESLLLQSRRTIAAALTVVAGDEVIWTVSRESSALEVSNLTDEVMAVTIRGEAVGTVAPGNAIDLRDLTTGLAHLAATGKDTGIRLEKDETLVPGATHRWELSTGAGLLTLVNAFSEDLEVYLDGVRSLALAPASEVTLSLPAGDHVVGWSSDLTDASGRGLVEISSAHAQIVTLGPGSARVAVTNRLSGAVALYLGGRFQARVAPKERATLCGLMGGNQLLEAIEEGGRHRVHRRKLALGSGTRATWEILPRTFTLVVENTTGEGLRALGDLEALIPELAAGDTARVEAPAGALRAVFAGKRTGILYPHEARGVEGGAPVDRAAPVGTLVVTNSTGREVVLTEAAREIAAIPVGGRAALEDLRPGPHTIQARAAGLLLGTKDFLVRPGSEFLWDLRPAYGQVRIVNRTDAEVTLLQDEQPTGRLFAGAETTLKNMPLVPVTLRAVHPTSGTLRAIRLTPSAESPPTWFIEPDSGQIEVRGLEGVSGELRPDQGAALPFDGSRDRVFLALSPGWHDVRILLEDGGEPDVRRVRVFAGQTTAMSLGGARFAIDVANGLEGPLQVELDGQILATIPGGATERLEGLKPGTRRFLARPAAGGAEVWLLREVTFQGGRTYRWTVPLEPAAPEDPRSIPIRDNIKSRRTPWVTYLILLGNVAAFVYELKLGDGLEDFIHQYGLVPWRLTKGIEITGLRPLDHLVPWFSSMFLHGGWLHLIGNMWFLWIFGDNVEDRLGPGKFVLFYLAGGLAAGMAQLGADPLSQVPMVGASGAMSAVLAAYVLLYPRARIVTLVPLFILFFFAEIPAWVFIGVWFLVQYFNGAAALTEATGGGGVAWWAHIGGFVAGIPLILVLKGPKQEVRRRDRPGSVTVIRRRR